MTKLERNINLDFYNKIAELLKNARSKVIQTVNKTMVYTYFEIGRTIVEEEQKGKERAEYGKQIIKELSQKLTREFGKGFSTTNLKQMRQFYLTYSKGQTLSDQFEKFDFQLSWSHYLFLRIYQKT
jgi:predicted GNAT family N-acyltransferase